MHACTRQRAGQGRAITAVIAFATKNKCFLVREVIVKPGTDCVHAGAACGFHQEQGRGVIVLNCKTVDLADLFGGKYRLHVWDDRERGKKGQSGPRMTRIWRNRIYANKA